MRHRFDFDFGFSYLTGALSLERAPGQTAPEAVAYAAKDWGAAPPGATAAAILDDTLRLLESPLSSGALATLWLAGTRRGYDLEAWGVDGRDWLHQITDICYEQLRVVHPSFTASAPEPASDTLAGAVLDELAQVAPVLTAATESSSPLYKVSGAVPALKRAVALCDPNLGFRLLLRTLSAYRVPISQDRFDRYEALGERFDFGEFHVNEMHFLTQRGA